MEDGGSSFPRGGRIPGFRGLSAREELGLMWTEFRAIPDLPPQDQSLGKTPSIMVNQEHWAEVCRGLIERGVCSADEERESLLSCWTVVLY